jgi:hypothetical protein
MGWLSIHTTANNNTHSKKLYLAETIRHRTSFILRKPDFALILRAIPLGFNRSGGRRRSSTGYWLIHLQYLCITSPQCDHFAFPTIGGPCNIECCFHPLTLAYLSASLDQLLYSPACIRKTQCCSSKKISCY